MNEIEHRYSQIINEFESLLVYGSDLSNSLAGLDIDEERLVQANNIFSKLLSHAFTLKNIAPSGLIPIKADTIEVWDLSSICALCRVLIETYDALAYIALEEISIDEREFRLLLWKLHAEDRRLQMLNLIGSTAPGVTNVEETLIQLRSELNSNTYIKTLDIKLRNEILGKRIPPFHLRSNERNLRNNVNHAYYTSAVIFTSAHVHTYPLAIQQLAAFSEGDPESLRLISVPLQYASGFLSKAIVGMQTLFTASTINPTPKVASLIAIWIEIVAEGVANTG